jgi:uncharacterized phage protein gp47/JayE
MIEKRLASQISNRAEKNLRLNTNLSFFGSGSIAKTIVNTMAREIEFLYDTIDLNISQTRISTASGVFLDLIGEQVGLSRYQSSSTSITASDKLIRFYAEAGRLIDLVEDKNATEGIIPSGTSIYSANGNIEYQTTSDIRFPANADNVWVDAAPADPGLGVRNNLPAGALSSHSLPQGISVENVAAIEPYSDIESDDQFRLRISSAMRASVTGSKAAVTQAALNFEGISDIVIEEYKYGAGSFEIMVIPTSSRVPEGALSTIKNVIKNIVPYGIRVEVRGPEVVPISMVVSLDFNPGTLASTKSEIRRRVRDSLRLYIGSIRLGGELIINRLRGEILGTDNAIRDINIRQIGIHCRPQVIANYRLRPDEVFDLDRKLQDPLLII